MRTVLALVFLAPLVGAQSLFGLWDASVSANGVTVPFTMEISSTDEGLAAGVFFNGADKLSSTSGTYEGGKLSLRFEYFGAKLDAAFANGTLSGSYVREERTGRRTYVFEARPHVTLKPAPNPPNIGGEWQIAHDSSKGEAAWKFLVRQTGGEAEATILRVDGDTGTLTGLWKDGKFALSHFSGSRPGIMEITPQADGSLHLSQIGLSGKNEYVALRPEAARAKGLAGPTDPTKHTSVKNAADVFRFRFPDLAGNMVSQDDPRFQGKVVIVSMTGSWCPNCHDEAPFLAQLYGKYHSQGLEIVGLAFEEEEQLKNPERLRAFVKQYGIEYPMLLGGEPEEANAKLPQMLNFNSWPTVFILGKDGRVAYTRAGFPGVASGDVYEQTKKELSETVEKLLAGAPAAGCATPMVSFSVTGTSPAQLPTVGFCPAN